MLSATAIVLTVNHAVSHYHCVDLTVRSATAVVLTVNHAVSHCCCVDC